jgi:hypothetical protein
MPLPGAYKSRQGPTLLKLDLASLESDEPTVMATGTYAGLAPHALKLAPALPAATTTMTPAAAALSIAVPIEVITELPPRLILIIAGLKAVCCSTQSIPLTIQDHAPLPWSLRTLTECMVASFATPYVDPPTVPAQCVP